MKKISVFLVILVALFQSPNAFAVLTSGGNSSQDQNFSSGDSQIVGTPPAKKQVRMKTVSRDQTEQIKNFNRKPESEFLPEEQNIKESKGENSYFGEDKHVFGKRMTTNPNAVIPEKVSPFVQVVTSPAVEYKVQPVSVLSKGTPSEGRTDSTGKILEK